MRRVDKGVKHMKEQEGWIGATALKFILREAVECHRELEGGMIYTRGG